MVEQKDNGEADNGGKARLHVVISPALLTAIIGAGLTTTFQSFLSTPGAYTTPVFTYSAATRYMKIRGILTLNSGDDFEITNFRVRKV